MKTGSKNFKPQHIHKLILNWAHSKWSGQQLCQSFGVGYL